MFERIRIGHVPAGFPTYLNIVIMFLNEQLAVTQCVADMVSQIGHEVKQSFEYMTERTADLAKRVQGFTRSTYGCTAGWGS